jgi:hypothetical protein
MIAQIPDVWDSHKILEYLKVVIRSVLTGLVGRSRKELKQDIEELEESLNAINNLKFKVCSLNDEKRKKEIPC